MFDYRTSICSMNRTYWHGNMFDYRTYWHIPVTFVSLVSEAIYGTVKRKLKLLELSWTKYYNIHLNGRWGAMSDGNSLGRQMERHSFHSFSKFSLHHLFSRADLRSWETFVQCSRQFRSSTFYSSINVPSQRYSLQKFFLEHWKFTFWSSCCILVVGNEADRGVEKVHVVLEFHKHSTELIAQFQH